MEYTALILFTLATSITPGPNNLMIMSSGANHGFRKSIPHLLGIDVGFPLMLIAVGLGASQVFKQVPELLSWLKFAGVIYLSYLALKIATTAVTPQAQKETAPFTFMQAALFQWVNPKAWIMAVSAVITYTVAGESYFLQVLTIALLFIIFGAPCTVAWLGFGTSLRQLLCKPIYLRVFNISMASLLFLSLFPIMAELYSQYV
jgi:threonine/homoserine/homoserine lactone efflux protein